MKRIENMMIGDTRLGSWSEVMNAPGNEWCHTVMKFNMIVLPTIAFLQLGPLAGDAHFNRKILLVGA